MLREPPRVGSELRSWLHVAIDYDASGPRYDDADGTCYAASSLTTGGNFYEVNTLYDTYNAMLSFVDQIIAHERYHEEGFSLCLGTEGQVLMEELEALTGTQSDVASKASSEWVDFYYEELRSAGDMAPEGVASSPYWFYDYDLQWKYAYDSFQGHQGQHGC